MPSAIITGGSKGFGRAVALGLNSRGWDVTITGRTPDSVRRTADDGPGIRSLVGDIREERHRSELVQLVGDRIDLLVNNASYLGPSPLLPLDKIPADGLHGVFDTNVVSALALIGLLMPALKRQGGTVVNVSSDAAVKVYENWGAYGASKAALDHASAVLAAEHPELTVYAFDPGDMRTDMHQAAFPGEDISDRPEPESVVPALLRLYEEHPPSGRYTAAAVMAKIAQ